MMRKFTALLIVPLALLFSVGTANAVFDNSHHDLRSYNAQDQGCFHCHGRLNLSSPAGTTAQLGAVGPLCLIRCHVGTGGLLGATDTLVPFQAASINSDTYGVTAGTRDASIVYFTNSHNRVKGALKGRTDNVVLSTTPAANWPYVSGTSTTIECTSCHSVHDNQNAPFLWAPLAPSAAGSFNGFCDRCHQERATNSMASGVAPDGNHPVNFVVDNTAASTRTGDTRHARAINIQNYAGTRIFDVANNFTAASMVNQANSWNLGGHVTSGQNAAMTNWTGAGSTQIMGCYTCHSAHRTTVTGESNLVVVETMASGATYSQQYNPLCVGCHGPSTTLAGDVNEWRVGTTQWGHPVGANTAGTPGTGGATYTASVGGFSFWVPTPSYQHGFAVNNEANQMGASGRVLCTSCHKVHFGTKMALANIGQGSAPICKSCHTGAGIPNVADASKGGTGTTGHNAANSHHVTNTADVANASLPKVGDPSITLVINNPSWATTGGLGDLNNGMDCADCHTFNGTAHNW